MNKKDYETIERQILDKENELADLKLEIAALEALLEK